jgi:signal transduction histidine kinase
MKLGIGPFKLHRLLIAVILPPILLFAIVAWLDRISVLDQATRNVIITSRMFAENAHDAFDEYRLVAGRVDERIHGMTWEEISQSEGLHQYLAGIVQDLPKIKSLSVVDPAGLLRASSGGFPIPEVWLTDRDYLSALRERDVGIFVGQNVHGRMPADDIINVAQRRSSPSGKFDGVIVVSASPSYFVRFWREVAPAEDAIAFLAHRDGVLLARIAPTGMTPPALAPDTPLMQAIGRADSGVFQAKARAGGRDHIIAYEKIDALPIYVGYGSTIEATLQIWHRHLSTYSAVFGLVTLGLTCLAVLAYQRTAGEVAALQHWRETAEKLTAEAEQRAVIEAQLRQSQKMEALGQLAGGMAHDFNNLLQVISGSTEVLQNRAAPADLTLLTLVRESAERGRKMVESMLAFARQKPLDTETFDLNDIVLGMEGLLHPALGSKVALNLVPAATACQVRSDRNQAELAILNLALNARDAMPGGGTLTVTVGFEHLDGTPAGLIGDYGIVAVRDTGIGMPPLVQARAFEPFFTTKGLGKGTGLGLSMVYGFAQQSHGAVTIDSKEGQGTTVTLYLPAGGQEAAPGGSPNGTPRSSA